MKKHRIIRLSVCNNILLFLSNMSLVPSCCWKEKAKLQKLYEESEEKIANHLDFIKIISNLQKLKLLLKNSMMDDKISYQLRHHHKFLIDLDNDVSEDSAGADDSIADSD